MNVKSKSFYPWVVLAALLPLFCLAAPMPNRPGPGPGQGPGYGPGSGDDIGSVVRQMRVTFADLKHEVQNHESEIRTFDDKLQNQESTLENLRQQLTDSLEAQKDYTRANSINLEGKIDSLDNTMKGVISDLRQMKSQANDSVNVLAQYKQKLCELEKIIDAQNQHMRGLETALNSMMEALQAKDAADRMMANKPAEGPKSYKVQPGDNLEKIAKLHKVTVKILRDYNPNLTNDKIVVGQTIRIP